MTAAAICTVLGTLILAALLIDIAFHLGRSPRGAVGREGHRERHALLHREFDELLADFLAHNRGALPSKTPILQLMEWSHGQTLKPDEPDDPNQLPWPTYGPGDL